jgi:hypothetical protein
VTSLSITRAIAGALHQTQPPRLMDEVRERSIRSTRPAGTIARMSLIGICDIARSPILRPSGSCSRSSIVMRSWRGVPKRVSSGTNGQRPHAEPRRLGRLSRFLAVCQVGRFTRAAAICGICQPSLSTAIRRLEQELGRPLFDRGPPVRLSPLGEAVKPHFEAILREIDNIHQRSSCFRGVTHSGSDQGREADPSDAFTCAMTHE